MKLSLAGTLISLFFALAFLTLTGQMMSREVELFEVTILIVVIPLLATGFTLLTIIGIIGLTKKKK